jgi:hypothetical protein
VVQEKRGINLHVEIRRKVQSNRINCFPKDLTVWLFESPDEQIDHRLLLFGCHAGINCLWPFSPIDSFRLVGHRSDSARWIELSTTDRQLEPIGREGESLLGENQFDILAELLHRRVFFAFFTIHSSSDRTEIARFLDFGIVSKPSEHARNPRPRIPTLDTHR